MKVKYFATFRQKLNISEEDIDFPTIVETGYDALHWLCEKDSAYKSAFSESEVCLAIEHELKPLKTSIKNAKEIAFFPPITGG